VGGSGSCSHAIRQPRALEPGDMNKRPEDLENVETKIRRRYCQDSSGIFPGNSFIHLKNFPHSSEIFGVIFQENSFIHIDEPPPLINDERVFACGLWREFHVESGAAGSGDSRLQAAKPALVFIDTALLAKPSSIIM